VTAKPVLIEAAINGVVRKSWNPHVPETLEEVRADVEASFAAGASIVHNHAAPGASGPNGLDFYVQAWEPVLARRPGALVYPTLGGSGSTAERIGHFEPLARRGLLRIGAVDPGSTNLGVLGDDGLPTPSESVYANSFAFIAQAIGTCKRLGLAMTFAIFEPTFLHTVLAYSRAGALPPGSWIKFYFGGAGGYAGVAPRERILPFGLPPTRAALDAYLEILGDAPLEWGVSAMGGDLFECGIARLALERGGHLHLGLETYAGSRQPTNAELIREAVELCRKLGREPLAWDRTARFLGIA
jgi:uncharacterized protein (DUF849 family)